MTTAAREGHGGHGAHEARGPRTPRSLRTGPGIRSADGTHHTHRAPRSASTTTGATQHARLAARTSRWFWLVWILALASLMPATLSAYRTTVPEGPQGQAMAAALGVNTTMRAMLGPPYDLLDPGGFAMWRVGTFVAAAAAMMAALGVLRATRADEEVGRTELLRAGPIGRHAPLAGALLVAFGACALLGAIIAVSLAALAPPVGSALAAGLGIALTGAVWAAVGAVAAQLSESTRTCRGVALGSLAAAYLLRALADGVPNSSALSALRWVSPVEWAALARPYADERWWVLALPALLTAALVALAFRLESVRDHGSGLRAARPGPAHGSVRLASAGGLVARLSRGSVIGWSVGLVTFSIVIGSLAGTIDTMLGDNPQLSAMFRRMGSGAPELEEAFFVAMLEIVAVLAAIFALSLLLRLRGEEEAGRTELMLSTATSRTRYALAHLVPALVLPTVLLLACGALVSLPSVLAGGDAGTIATYAGSALVLSPGVWVVVGFAMLVLGLRPRLLWLPWALVAWTLFVSWVGGLLRLPDALMQATPFAPLPRVPAEAFAWGPVLLLTALAVLLLGAGLAGFRRRDIG